MFWPIHTVDTGPGTIESPKVFIHNIFCMFSQDVITLPYQSELVEYSAVFSDVTSIQRYSVPVTVHSPPHPPLSLTLSLPLSPSLFPTEL